MLFLIIPKLIRSQASLQIEILVDCNLLRYLFSDTYWIDVHLLLRIDKLA